MQNNKKKSNPYTKQPYIAPGTKLYPCRKCKTKSVNRFFCGKHWDRDERGVDDRDGEMKLLKDGLKYKTKEEAEAAKRMFQNKIFLYNPDDEMLKAEWSEALGAGYSKW